MLPPATITKYGAKWKAGVDPLTIEFTAIQNGGKWRHGDVEVGEGLFTHYRNAMSLLWPEDDHHRWSDLALKALVEEEIVIFCGCGDSNKTYSMSRFILVDWWAFPQKTLWLISSTEYRGAELRIWGKIKELYNRAKRIRGWLDGNVLESMHAITTEDIDDDQDLARSLQRGLIVVPNKKGNTSIGLGAFVGVKAPRLRHAGDEVQAMTPGFADAYSNWYGKEDFRGCMAGNPLDITDQLCQLAEPHEGWDSWVDTEKTQTWRSNFFNAFVVAFDGRDSPNFDFPDTGRSKFPYLIGKKKLEGVASTHGKDSWQWFSQCVGKPNKGMVLWRVITRLMCQQNKAFETVVWKGNETTKIYYLDPAYGGGDRCVGGVLEFGDDSDNNQIIRCYEPEIVPINLRLDIEPEEQIARYVKRRLDDIGIRAENAFYDSFGRGTLGFYFAQVFGEKTPVPIDSGAMPTTRPVRFDLFIDEPDGNRRLKRCDEHYSKFISELWFSVSEAIQSQQIRELPKSQMLEGCARIYKVVSGNRIEVEPKADMKERIGKSPDLFDALAIGVEGARRLGFKIKRIGADVIESDDDEDFFDKEAKEWKEAMDELLLTHDV
jgi:hypothetical protein